MNCNRMAKEENCSVSGLQNKVAIHTWSSSP